MSANYFAPQAAIWSAAEIDAIEAEMAYGSSSWPTHSEGTSTNSIILALGKTHRGTSTDCWIKFTTKGSCDVKCSICNGSIRIYDDFRNNPLDIINIGNGSMFRTLNAYGSVTRYIRITPKSNQPTEHYCHIEQHLDTHAFDHNAGGAYWVPQSNKYRADPDITPLRVVYLPGDAVDSIYQLIEDNPVYSNAANFFDSIDYVAETVMEWGASTGNGYAFLAATALRVICNLTERDSAQSVIDRIKSNRSLYCNGIRAEETLNVYSPQCQCSTWDGISAMRGIAGCVGDWFYIQKGQ